MDLSQASIPLEKRSELPGALVYVDPKLLSGQSGLHQFRFPWHHLLDIHQKERNAKHEQYFS